MRLKGSKQLREEYLATLQQKQVLLEKFRNRQHLSAEERQAVWVCISDIVYSKAKMHYKAAQPYGRSVHGRSREWYEVDPTHPGYELHVQRMELFIEFLRRRSDKSVGWVVSTWKRRFHQFEGLRELRGLGIKYKTDGTLISEQSAIVRDYIIFSRIIRQVQARGETPTHRSVMNEWLRVEFNTGRSVSPMRYHNAVQKLDEYKFIQSLSRPASLEYISYDRITEEVNA